jgi:deoxyhypusine synthase
MTNKKGQKRLKNVPLLYDEIKAKRTVVLTPTAWQNIKDEAQRQGLSASELIEEFGRRINSPTANPHK